MCLNFLQLNADKTEIIVSDAKEGNLKVNAHLDSLFLKTQTISSWLEYCNGLFSGLPKKLSENFSSFRKLLLVLTNTKKSHVTSVLRSLHWLPVC